MTDYAEVETPIGTILVAGRAGALTHLRLPDDDGPQAPDADWRPGAWPRAAAQIAAYFAGRLTAFDLPLAPAGTAFQRAVWTALRDIPVGHTRSYADIAAAVDRPGGGQAVGQANGRNPIPLLIPCHRVVAADGTLGGFSGSPNVKRRLLEHEGALQPRLL